MRLVAVSMMGAGILLLGSPDRAQAQWGIAPYAGYNLDAEELYLGAALHFTLPARIGRSQLIASPSFDLYPFIGDGSVQGVDYGASLYMVNLDVLYPFAAGSSLAPYVGAGLAVSHASVTVTDPSFPGQSFSASETDVGLNLKGGAAFTRGRIRPFAEGVLVMSSGSALLLRGGMLFSLGR